MSSRITNITLIMPNFNWRVDTDVKKDPPMGLLYIASCLETLGYRLQVIDAHAEELTMDDVIKRLRDTNPQLVGVSCNYAPLHNITMELCSRVKNELKNTVTVVGGNHASASYRDLLAKSRDIDFVILGQGEYIFSSLLEMLNSPIEVNINRVAGIAYTDNGNIIKTSSAPIITNLDELPMPAYHLVDMSNYDRYNIITTRGCPFNCNYCASNVITRNRVCRRNPRYIVNEIKHLISKYGKKMVWFSDDTFTANKKFVNDLMDMVISADLGIEWSCLTRVNVTDIDTLKKMKRAGCKYISYGVESGNEEMLERMNKKITLCNVEQALKDTKEAGLDIYLFFIVGYPGDTREMENDSVTLVQKLQPTGVGYNIFIPLPGTQAWAELSDRGLIGFDMIEWDRLFARTSWSDHDDYPAKLSSTWCDMTPDDIIEVCKEGEQACH